MAVRWVLVALILAGCDDLSLLRALADGGGDAGALGDLSGLVDLAGSDATATGLCDRSPASCPAQAFCDGFESATGSTFPGWNRDVGNYTGGAVAADTQIAVDTSRACRGQNSARSRVYGTTQYAIIGRDLSLPNPLYVRFYYYWPSTPGGQRFQMIYVGSGTQLEQLAVEDGAMGMGWNTFGGAYRSFPVQTPRDRWTCVEVMIKHATVDGEVSLRINEQLVGTQVGLDTQPTGVSPNRISFGVTLGDPPAGPVEVYYDEVVIAGSPIGC